MKMKNNNAYYLEKLKSDLYSMYENKIDWTILEDKEILNIACEVKFFGKTHDTLLNKILSLNRLQKDKMKMMKLLECYSDNLDVIVTALRTKIFYYHEIKPFVIKFLKGSDLWHTSSILKLVLCYKNEIKPEIVRMIERKKEVVDQRLSLKKLSTGSYIHLDHQNYNAGLRH